MYGKELDLDLREALGLGGYRKSKDETEVESKADFGLEIAEVKTA